MNSLPATYLLRLAAKPQAYADRLSALFVPSMIVAAFATWLSWYLAGISGEGRRLGGCS